MSETVLPLTIAVASGMSPGAAGFPGEPFSPTLTSMPLRVFSVVVLFWTYAVWYGTGRIITDFLRVENRFLGLTGSQWTSTIVVAFGVFTLVRFALRPAAAEQSEPAGPGTPAAA